MRGLSNNISLISKISNSQGVIKEAFIGKNPKSFNILSFQFRVWVKLIQNPFLNSIGLSWPLEKALPLKWADHLSGTNYLSGIDRLSEPCFFWKIILNHFKYKNDT